MITYRDWTITSSGLLARQYDNLSRRVEVIGDLPAGWEWDLIVKVEGAMDVIALTPMDGGVGHTLTKDQVSIAGYYSVQLRGRQGETVKHTNVIQVFVPASLSGDGQWPTVPSEFTEMEKRLWELNDHPPTPGKNGFWQIWDPDRDEYVDSDIPYVSSGAGGVTGDYIPVPAFAEVGQTIRVSAVDETGKPIKWEAVDMAGGGSCSCPEWEIINEVTTTEEVTSVMFSTDLHGNTFDLLEGMVSITAPSAIPDTLWYIYFAPAIKNYTTHNIGSRVSKMSIEWNTLSAIATICTDDIGSSYGKVRPASINGDIPCTEFRFLNWYGMVLPVGTKIRLIGRRKQYEKI